ncbi:response regulator transcription factor [Alphaproteobacteria bacterium]|nr:response regulator transcription factor [Alphaproteobacteria bacterium]
MKKVITIVDDDINILTSLSIFLKSEGFNVFTYSNGLETLNKIKLKESDLYILDIKMPNINGMDLLIEIKKLSSSPIIFLTSKADEIDEVIGLKLGADDYIKKPFSQRLLLERIKTLLRRHVKEFESTVENEIIFNGNLYLNSQQHICRWKNKSIQLTVTEFLILESLAKKPGHVKSRDQLMQIAYSDHIFVEDRTIDSHIKRLRKKFRNVDESFNNIETLYGIGYCFRSK